MTVVALESGKRAQNREMRRQQLISATIKSISRRGISGTTMAEVAKEAGLSVGIVNLHFDTKDNLLNQTLQHLADEYKELFESAPLKAGPGPADKLLAFMEHGLKPKVCDRQKMAVWFAFWGEAKSVPTYQKICARHDEIYTEILDSLCQEIIDDGHYTHVTSRQATDALAAMTDGMWLSCLISPKSWDRRAAMDAVYSYLRGVFPKHYELPRKDRA